MVDTIPDPTLIFLSFGTSKRSIKLAASKVAAASSCKMVTRGHARVIGP